jgi:hypothetical protein
MGTTNTVAAPEAPTDAAAIAPFTYTFESYSTAHCSYRIETVLEELDFTVERADDDTADDIRTRLNDLVDLNEDGGGALDEDTLAAIRTAIDELRPCADNLCDCATFAWESEKEWADDELDRLGDRLWVVTSNDEGRDIISDRLTLDDLFDRSPMSRSYGYDDVTITWDGTELVVSFSGYPWGSDTQRVYPLSGVREAAYAAWTGCDCDANDVMAERLTAASEEALTLACEIVEADLFDFDRRWFTQLLTMCEALAGPEHDAARQMALGLLADWDDSVDDLVATCLALEDHANVA